VPVLGYVATALVSFTAGMLVRHIVGLEGLRQEMVAKRKETFRQMYVSR